jgi:uncharacterized protein YciI
LKYIGGIARARHGYHGSVAQEPGSSAGALPEADPPEEVEEFTLVLLMRPPDAPEMDEAALEKLQRQHLGHLQMLKQQGALLFSGPFRNQPDESWRGLCIYKTDLEETRMLAERDPSVRAGRLRIVTLRWMTAKGVLKAPSEIPA